MDPDSRRGPQRKTWYFYRETKISTPPAPAASWAPLFTGERPDRWCGSQSSRPRQPRLRSTTPPPPPLSASRQDLSERLVTPRLKPGQSRQHRTLWYWNINIYNRHRYRSYIIIPESLEYLILTIHVFSLLLHDSDKILEINISLWKDSFKYLIYVKWLQSMDWSIL